MEYTLLMNDCLMDVSLSSLKITGATVIYGADGLTGVAIGKIGSFISFFISHITMLIFLSS